MKNIFLFLLAPALLMPFFVSAQEGVDGFVSDEDVIVIESEEVMAPVSVDDLDPELLEQARQEWGIDPSALSEEIDCFDYYTFQSVNITASPQKEIFQPGESVDFSGYIMNENSYPVVDGYLYVRIGEKNENYDTEWHYIVDEFFALENVAIDANTKKDVTFSWTVPAEIKKGEYNVDYFFSVGKKFNIGGLPFSNEVVAGSSDFEINSVNEGYFSFDRAGSTVNGEKYQQIGNWPIVPKGESVEVVHRLNNSRSQDVNAVVTFELYFWDSLRQEDRITTEQVAVTVPSGGSEQVSYTIPEAQESVYYLKTTAKQNDLTSIINARFSVDGGERVRLNYPAITQFPVKNGDEFTLFSCFHNATYAKTEGSVSISLFDKSGNVIARELYEGSISSAMSVLAKQVQARGDYDYLKLRAEIKDVEGNVVDYYETEYSCEKIAACEKKGGVVETVKENTFMQVAAFGLFIVLCLVIIAVLFKMMKDRKGIASLLFALSAMALFGFVDHVDAGTWSVNASQGYDHWFTWVACSTGRDFTSARIVNGSATATYRISGANSMPCEGSVTYRDNSVLSFNASGGSWDTPTGKFCSNWRSTGCFGGNITRPNYGSSYYFRSPQRPSNDGWNYVTARKPSISLSSNNNSILKCSGMRCTAQPGRSGTVRVTATIAANPVRSWAYYKMADWWCGVVPEQYDGRHYMFAIDKTFPRRTVSWNVTVGTCSVDGACNSDSTHNDYLYTASGPSTPLCSAGVAPTETPTFPVGIYGADSEVTWICGKVGSGQDSGPCRAQRMPPPDCACSSMMNDQEMSYLQTAWPDVFCEEGAVVGNPPIFPGIGGSASWQCGGATCSNGPVDCSVTRGTPPPCECGTANQSQSTAAPASNLCNAGNSSSVTGGSVWNWTCGTDYDAVDLPPGANNGQCTDQASCEAECVDVKLEAPEYVYMQEGETKTVDAYISIDGDTSYMSNINCEIDGQPVSFSSGTGKSDSVSVSVSGESTTINAECSIDVDCGNSGSSSTRVYNDPGTMSQVVRALCMQRSCNAQGRCQATPQSISSGECTSTCSSDADCSTGRMIETRP